MGSINTMLTLDGESGFCRAINNINAQLKTFGAVGLVVISVVLTFIAGLIPSGMAAKKDPVEALRTE